MVEERDADVERVELGRAPVAPRVVRRLPVGELPRLPRAEHVGVPQGEVAALAVVAAGLLAQPEDRVLLAARPAQREGVVQGGVRPVAALVVGGGLHYRSPVRPMHVDPERVQPQRDRAGAGADAHPVVVADHSEVRHLGQRIHAHRVRRGLVELPAAADLDPHHVIPDHVDPQPLPVQLGLHPGRRVVNGVDPFVADVVVGLDHADWPFRRRCTPSSYQSATKAPESR